MTPDVDRQDNECGRQAESIPTAVIGLGTMGHGIVQTIAAAGYQVRGYDESSQARQSTLDRIAANLDQMQALGLIDDALMSATLSRISVADSERDAVDGAQFVTEAVREDLGLKQELFERLEAAVAADTILASNTSSYPISDISVRMRHRERAIVTHWFNPPHIMPVVEIVPGDATSAATTNTVYNLLSRIGKTPVRLNQEIPGFLVNRIQIAMFREIWDLLDRGIASPEDIDQAIRGSMGLRLAALGPLAVSDFAGWDVTSRVYENLVRDIRSDEQLPQRIQQLVQAKHYGVKTGRGIFDYPAQSVPQKIADRDRTYLKLVQLLAHQAEQQDSAS